MRSYKKLALLAFIAAACLTTNVRAEEESIVDTVVEDTVVSDGASEYIDTTTEAVVDTETVEESTESTKEEEEVVVEVEESAEETPEPVVEEDVIEAISEDASSLKSKISDITDKLRSKISKQDAKKIAAFGIGAWGAATGVGWIVDKFGKSAE
jgi:benzoyl-CoA reductase/2-hydroxyglutaryl-CoA dehydratase subunit BcrC/BadD/HgdB